MVFRREGWPLCLHDRVVIQLAPINPLLLRPGDFYLQVEAFGEQAARIVLKSLLVQEEGLVEQGSFGSSQGSLGVEETPILETSYPCIFTKAWLEEVNEGRHGTPLRKCVLSSDQGVVKVPWAEIAKPEFLDRPKSGIPSMSSPLTGMVLQDIQTEGSSSEAQSSVQTDLSSLTMETVILPAKDGIAVSLRLTGGNSKLVKVDQGMPVSNLSGKPVGWVSPNTWDTRLNREIEGEYVDLVEFNKEKEALALNKPITPMVPVQGLKPVRPAPPVPKRDRPPPGGPKKLSVDLCTPCSKAVPLTLDLESKNRHRESYLAALMNPVNFGRSLPPLEETWTDTEELDLSAGGCGACPGQTPEACQPGYSSQTTPEGASSQKPRQSGPTGQPCCTADCGSHPKNTGPPPQSLQHCHEPESSRGRGELQKGHNGQKFPRTQMLRKLGQQCKPSPDTGLACQGSPELEEERQQQQTPLVPQDPCQAKQHKAPVQSQTPHQAAGPQTVPPTKSPLHSSPGAAGHHPNSLGEVTQGAPEHLVQAEVLKLWGKGRAKQHSLSSVSDSARECLQAQRMPGRSLSDVCPEVIPTVRVIHNKKTTAFGLVSPKMDRKPLSKQSKKGNGAECFNSRFMVWLFFEFR